MNIIISQKHIDKMIQQGIANNPFPSGGFLGGSIKQKEKIIFGIYPIKKIIPEQANIGFCYTSIDFQNAQNFFFINNITFLGSYNITYKQKTTQLVNRQKIGYGCQEIISIDLSNCKSPKITAHQKTNGIKKELKLIIVTESEIKDYNNSNETLSDNKTLKNTPNETTLTSQIENLKNNKKIHYIKNKSLRKNSSFDVQL
tara:strand:- start:930 stop:1529 length:600 start_codon:yes stop_codon:yes gene_type:complete